MPPASLCGDSRLGCPAGKGPAAPPRSRPRCSQASTPFESRREKTERILSRKLAAGPIDSKLAATLNQHVQIDTQLAAIPTAFPGPPLVQNTSSTAPRFTYAHLELPSDGSRRSKRLAEPRKAACRILQRAIEKNTRLLDQNSTPRPPPLH